MQHIKSQKAALKVVVFSAQPYDKCFLNQISQNHFPSLHAEVVYHITPLSEESAPLAAHCDAVCVFVNDCVNESVLKLLYEQGVRGVFLRCSGFDNVDLKAAEEFGMFVARVPAYSPEAIAEFSVALMLTLNRRTHRAYNRTREGNFNLGSLLGFNMHRKTVGIVGVGNIGLAVARILKGFGCNLVAHDPYESDDFKVLGSYTTLEDLLRQSDIVTLHCPLLDSTKHLINRDLLKCLKKGAMLINTSRGGILDTAAVIDALKSGQIGALGLDVYEKEASLFYVDRSSDIIHDDVFQRLVTFPNVLVTGHQAFLTEEALTEIAETTFQNLQHFADGSECRNALVGGGAKTVK
ncbi:hypothetical protein BG015_001281 [Linnemannia schmuckeri]|uniref:D-lactate dehydrogenase n=1 Tax=Linnemannia schmuckeri TaxID=64567 RepID=A0A9P5RQF3_9FUNG|nr:hypothetical protein BG015_001281 [Linnemannia schmuckeri]